MDHGSSGSSWLRCHGHAHTSPSEPVVPLPYRQCFYHTASASLDLPHIDHTAESDSYLEINHANDQSRTNRPSQVSQPATRNDLSRRNEVSRPYNFATCPKPHVLVCLKGNYSQLAWSCFFCGRAGFGVIFQCTKCGTYICSQCKESEKKKGIFPWVRGQDPPYFGR